MERWREDDTLKERRIDDDFDEFGDLVSNDSLNENERSPKEKDDENVRESRGGAGAGALADSVRDDNNGDDANEDGGQYELGGRQLFIRGGTRGISLHFDENRLRQLFEQFGTVCEATVRTRALFLPSAVFVLSLSQYTAFT